MPLLIFNVATGGRFPGCRFSDVAHISNRCNVFILVHHCLDSRGKAFDAPVMSFPPPPDDPHNHDKNDVADDPHNPAVKPGAKPDGFLNIASFSGDIRVPSPDPSLLSIEDDGRWGGAAVDSLTLPRYPRRASLSPVGCPRTLKSRFDLFWINNKGLALVLFSQLFGTLMNVTTRKLEIEGNNGQSVPVSSLDCTPPKSTLINDADYRSRVSSVPGPVRAHVHNCSVCDLLHVAFKDRIFSVRHEGSQAIADC